VRGEPQLVIFDCDGVLVDSEVISNRVLAETLTDEGLPTTTAEARRDYQGLLLADVLANAQAKLGHPLSDEWMTGFERDRTAAFRRELRPVAGVSEAVQRLGAAGIAVCVASQGKLEKTSLSLALTGLDLLFPERARFSAESVRRGKPAPDLFLYAAAAMQTRPANCVVVEDTPSGVTAAVLAGMRALGYVADSDEPAMRDAGAETLRSFAELPALLGLD
jgi:HAD superfamily hydrolase (TIGR01509 family)